MINIVQVTHAPSNFYMYHTVQLHLHSYLNTVTLVCSVGAEPSTACVTGVFLEGSAE